MKRLCLFFVTFVFLGVNYLCAQTVQVTGVVTDAEDGNPIPGGSVTLKGTTIGTSTDLEGRYTLSAPQDVTTIVFSFIGYKTKEVEIEGRNIINISLQEDALALEEIVVVGYGTQIKRKVTGSISSVTSEDIEEHTMPSFETAIHGKTAGVHMSAGSGKLGQVVRTRIRGSSSISASNQPLYVIDGVPVISQNLGTAGNEPTNPIADLNPNDIESIQVLKDASAAAIYGSRASNGVIIVTTKRGKEGKTKFNFSTQFGFSEPANKIGYLNREQYLDLFKEAYSNVAGGPNEPYWGGSLTGWEDALDWGIAHWRDVDDPTNLKKGPDTNWEDEALRNGGIQQVDLSASGGNEDTKFFAALSFLDHMAIVNGNTFDRISGRLNLDQRASDFLSFGLNMNLARSRNFRVANDRAFASPLQMIALPPLQPTHDPVTGELNRSTLYENGLVVREYNKFDTEVFRNFGNVYAQLDLLPGLTFRSEAGVDLLNQREVEYRGRLTNDGGPDGWAMDRSVTAKVYNLENFFNYNFSVNNDYQFDIVAGSSLQYADFDFASMTARGFPNDNFKRIANASDILSASSSGTGYRYTSFFSRANIDIFDKYLLSISARADGSSRFGKDNRYGFFPAASLGWIVTNEDFLVNNDILSFLKPRLSWGVTGNSEINDFASRGLYLGSNYAGLSGMVSSSLASPDLKWETTTQTNIGLDFGFFDNRISGEIDYYVKKTTDLLLSVQVPATSGYNSVYRNVGEMENKGWEFMLNTVNVTGKFKWNTSFNIAFNSNEVSNLDGQIIQSSIWRVMEGEPLGVFYTKEYAGVDPDNGDALFYLNETGDETTTNLAAAANRIVGDPNPDFWGGLTNNFSYAGFDLNIMLQYVYGHDIYNHGFQWQADGFSWFDNQTVYLYENHWKEPGDNTYYPQPRFAEGNGYGVSSMLIFDASYLRVKEVSLGYTIPTSLVQRVGVDNARVYVRGSNLFTFTEYPGWDPETSAPNTADITTQTSNIRQGWDFYTAPQSRIITFGLTLDF